MDKRYQIFVSSTYADLKEERSKVMQTIMEMDCIPAGMELFPASDEEQFEFIKRIIDDCDYYLLIIGGRYGSITNEGISFTELEYDYALSLGLKVIAFLHSEPNKISVEKSDIDPALRQRLQNFRDRISTGRLVKFWKNADELPGLVALSLTKTIKAYPAIGWVRANKATEIQNLKDSLQELIKGGVQELGIQEIKDSRKSYGNYFTQVASQAKVSVESVLVTGGFIPGVELSELISELSRVRFHFYLLDPASSHLKQREQDTKDKYPVGKGGDGYQDIIDLTKEIPERVFLDYYDEYPFWHYVMIDNETLYLSSNPLGAIGYSTSPVYILKNNGNSKSLFELHREHLRVLSRNAEIRKTILDNA
ncbi:MAG: DUF4062 domain-containing protein [candidate division Zixibacteria bacterium]|nr:DUF4062 domain-containing protein [candidate division Zixibacteria bacterium]MBU1471613.1 DUF4062 domain-containing protein [candidate division Zixibacteria bacterium]MBU2626710.1 DUF4062 domain-containing protein [candidate division Zixibacteria bacterium]